MHYRTTNGKTIGWGQVTNAFKSLIIIKKQGQDHRLMEGKLALFIL
jgi:hypothetical protein